MTRQEELEEVAKIPKHTERIFFRSYYMSYFMPPPRGRILDLGAYMGANLFHYAFLGHECVGVEGAKTCVAMFEAERRKVPTEIAVRTSMHCGMIEDFEVVNGDLFDAVICGEVLEHSLKPEAIAEVAYGNLLPGGVCFLAVLKEFKSVHKSQLDCDDLCHLMSGVGIRPQRALSTDHHNIAIGIK